MKSLLFIVEIQFFIHHCLHKSLKIKFFPITFVHFTCQMLNLLNFVHYSLGFCLFITFSFRLVNPIIPVFPW